MGCGRVTRQSKIYPSFLRIGLKWLDFDPVPEEIAGFRASIVCLSDLSQLGCSAGYGPGSKPAPIIAWRATW